MKKFIIFILFLLVIAAGVFVYVRRQKPPGQTQIVTERQNKTADSITEQSLDKTVVPYQLSKELLLDSEPATIVENKNVISSGKDLIGGQRSFYSQKSLSDLYTAYVSWFKNNSWTLLEQTNSDTEKFLSAKKENTVVVISLNKDTSSGKNLVNVRATQTHISKFR